MKSTDFIETAKRLLLADATEADARTAVSRAYYGAFHSCLAALPVEFAPSEGALREGGSHKIVIDAVERWGRSTSPGRSDARDAARRIAQLKRSRVVADYRLANVMVADPAQCVKDAESVAGGIARGRRLYDEQ